MLSILQRHSKLSTFLFCHDISDSHELLSPTVLRELSEMIKDFFKRPARDPRGCNDAAGVTDIEDREEEEEEEEEEDCDEDEDDDTPSPTIVTQYLNAISASEKNEGKQDGDMADAENATGKLSMIYFSLRCSSQIWCFIKSSQHRIQVHLTKRKEKSLTPAQTPALLMAARPTSNLKCWPEQMTLGILPLRQANLCSLWVLARLKRVL